MSITKREYHLGEHCLTAAGAEVAEAPFIIAGPRLYAIGRGSGAVGPIGAEHLVGEMGGVWAHPVKVADGFVVALRSAGEQLLLTEGVFTERPTEIRWDWAAGDLCLTRRDRVLPGEPAYATLITVANPGPTASTGTLAIEAHLAFRGCWFGGMPTQGGTYRVADHLVLGHDAAQPGWGVALGTAHVADAIRIAPQARGAVVTLEYGFTIEARVAKTWLLLLCINHTGGEAAAATAWRKRIRTASACFADDDADYLAGLPRILSDAADLSRDAALAQANLRLLEADYPDLGPFFLAGLPEYPQLFGCDTAYTVPGAVAGGFAATARCALATLGSYAARACGRVPHEITTNGRVFNPGNLQETPQFAIALWDYLRWTGDLELARRLFPICYEGLTAYVPAIGGPDPRYPMGDGMVERTGMGSRKLDTACYLIAGLRALARVATAIGDPDATALTAHADTIHAAFERDWWLEDEGLYADSMHADGSLQLDGHWTQVLPVQLGLAAPARAERVLDRLEAEFVNAWGLVHTRHREELVWTLPTGLLALAAFRAGRAERGLELAANIARTAERGTLGAFKELIPEGLCFVQLWSAGLYLQAILEGLLGLQPDASAHTLVVAPSLPECHPTVHVRGLAVGAHRLNLAIAPRALALEHIDGPEAFTVHYAGATHSAAPATTLRLTLSERRHPG